MRKFFLLGLLVVLMLSLMAGVALAGGWTSIDYNVSHDPDDKITGNDPALNPDGIAIWNPNQAETDEGQRSPHGGFSSTSNFCRVCHAVHMAGTDSWRLLRDGTNVNGEDRGTDRASECNFCHGQTGATYKRPFRPKNYDVRGEHTIGATLIPDALDGTTGLGTGGLSCGDCHTVHGGNDLSPGFTGGFDTDWSDKILRNDPNKDGDMLALNETGRATTGTAAGVKSNFCADCHDQNPNWNLSDTSGEATRTNGRSHVQGPAADGSLEVYGNQTKVAGWSTIDGNGDGVGADQDTKEGCRACHYASSAGNLAVGIWSVDTTGGESAFPHQTKGSKLLFDSYTEDNVNQTAANTQFSANANNDASRILPRMDQLCAKCHVKGGDVDTAVDGAGVGLSF